MLLNCRLELIDKLFLLVLFLFQLLRLALCVRRQVDEIGNARCQRTRPANQADHIGFDIESALTRGDAGRLRGFEHHAAVDAGVERHRRGGRQIGDVGIAVRARRRCGGRRLHRGNTRKSGAQGQNSGDRCRLVHAHGRLTFHLH